MSRRKKDPPEPIFFSRADRRRWLKKRHQRASPEEIERRLDEHYDQQRRSAVYWLNIYFGREIALFERLKACRCTTRTGQEGTKA